MLFLRTDHLRRSRVSVFIAANDAAHRELQADILKIYERALQRAVGADMSRGCVVDRKQGLPENNSRSIVAIV